MVLLGVLDGLVAVWLVGSRPLCPSDISPVERGKPCRLSAPGILLRSQLSFVLGSLASPFVPKGDRAVRPYGVVAAGLRVCLCADGFGAVPAVEGGLMVFS